MRTSRVAMPLMSMRATPSARCSRRLTTWSARMDSSRAERFFDISASTTIGEELSLLKRAMVGAFTSLGNAGWMADMRSRRSSIARFMLASSENSTWVWLRPSKLREVILRTPATVLSASSTVLLTSRSTASGEAPG